jgi:hypothetical protein
MIFAAPLRNCIIKGYSTPLLVLATLPEPQFRSRDIVAEAISLARRELSMEPYVGDRGRA